MGRVSFLLDKPLRRYILYSMVVLLAIVPVYFWAVESIWKAELNEHNEIIAEKFRRDIRDIRLEPSEWDLVLETWNRIQPGTWLEPVREEDIRPDSTYNVMRPSYGKMLDDRFQGLVSYIYINQEPYRLVIETNMEEAYETFVYIGAVSFFSFLVLVIGFIVLNRKISRIIWRPFHQTLGLLREYRLDSRKMPQFEPSGIAEFEELNENLAQLIERNQVIFNEQKEFTENASHELQTPLAIIQSKVDSLLQTEGLTQAQFDLLEQLQKAVFRTSKITQNLLLLAKLENRQFDRNDTIDLRQMLQENSEAACQYVSVPGLEIRNDIRKGGNISGNRVLADILVRNLLQNAMRYTVQPGGLLEIKCSANRLSISNTGTEALSPEKLFKRFSRVSSEKIGVGVGLAIVKRICDFHGWGVTYRFERRMHIFEVDFSGKTG